MTAENTQVAHTLLAHIKKNAQPIDFRIKGVPCFHMIGALLRNARKDHSIEVTLDDKTVRLIASKGAHRGKKADVDAHEFMMMLADVFKADKLIETETDRNRHWQDFIKGLRKHTTRLRSIELAAPNGVGGSLTMF